MCVDRRRDRGFTLVEILIAIVLVGILSAVVVVGAGSLTSTGSAAACQTSLDAARVATTAHTVSTGSAPTSFTAMVSSGSLSMPAGVSVDAGGRRLLGNGWQLVMQPGVAVSLVCADGTTSGALDATSTSAAAAYGMRKLGVAYTGPALRVRRSSDNAQQDIGFATTTQTRQNLLQNPQLAGAVPGAPGTLPSRWIQRVSTIPLEVLGSGTTTDGQAYVDLRFVGTASSAATNRLSFDGAGGAGQGVASTVGQTVLVSAGIQLLAGVAPAIGLGVAERDTAGAYVGLNWGPRVTPTATSLRRSLVHVNSASSTVVVQGEITFPLTAGSDYDFSIRILQPNIELDRRTNVRPLTTNDVTVVAEPGDLDVDGLETFVGSSSAFVATWYDQSGNGHHAVQASAAAQPAIVTAGAVVTLGGRPVMFFDGNDVLPLTGSTFGTQAAPFAAVTTYRRQDPAVGNRSVWGNRGGASDGGRVLRSTQGSVGYFQTGITGVGPTLATDDAGIVHSVRVDAELRQRVNGGSDAVSATTAIGSTHGGWAFGVQGATFDPQHMVGSIAEALFFETATTTADIQTLERSQGAYFGITVA